MKHSPLVILLLALFGAGFAAMAAEPVGTKQEAKAAADNGQTIQLQPGVKVTMTGKNRGTLKRGSVSGEFYCNCSFLGGGSCTLVTGSTSLSCIKDQGDTCIQQCTLTTKYSSGKSKIVK